MSTGPSGSVARGRLLPLYISTGCAVVGSVLVYGSPRRLAEIATTVRQDLEHYSATHTTGDVLVATIVLQVLLVQRHAKRALCRFTIVVWESVWW